MVVKTSTFNIRVMVYGTIILAWALSAYLMYRSNHLPNNSTTIPDLCNLVFGNSCDKVLSSKFSWHLGYPLAGWGLVFFGLQGLLFSLHKPLTDRIVTFLAALGLGVGIVQSAFILRTGIPCPLCLTIHGSNLLTLLALFWISKSTSVKRSRLRWMVLLLLAVVVGSATEYGILKASIGKKAEVNIDEIAKNFQTEQVYNIPKNEASPHIGSLDAPVQLVVFSSFQCPACKSFAPSLENIHKKFGKNIGITFKNFPLSTSCNPIVVADMQPKSCDAAFAAIAAQRQGFFWKYHDLIFQSNLEFDEKTLTAAAQNIGLNMEQWELDRQSAEVQESMAADLKIAYKLGINATPSVFINGRRSGNFQESVLTFLIQYELDKISN